MHFTIAAKISIQQSHQNVAYLSLNDYTFITRSTISVLSLISDFSCMALATRVLSTCAVVLDLDS